MRYPLNRPRVKVGFGFGDPWFNTGKLHTGEDDQAAAGEAIYAPADGVLYNHTVDPKWGNGIVMDFGNGSGCCIWHVDHMVPDGSQVKEGDRIATIYDLQGNTHMHLSFWVGAYDENLRAGALFPGVWPDRFVEPDSFLDSHPAQGGFHLDRQMKGALVRSWFVLYTGGPPPAVADQYAWADIIGDNGEHADEVQIRIANGEAAPGNANGIPQHLAALDGRPSGTGPAQHTHPTPAGTTGGPQ